MATGAGLPEFVGEDIVHVIRDTSQWWVPFQSYRVHANTHGPEISRR